MNICEMNKRMEEIRKLREKMFEGEEVLEPHAMRCPECHEIVKWRKNAKKIPEWCPFCGEYMM
jgi:hypothetical protein